MISTSSWGMPTYQDKRFQSEETTKPIHPTPPNFLDEECKAEGVPETMVTLKVKEKLLSRVQLFVTPWAVAYPAPPSMGFFQVRMLEWVATAFSRGSSQPRGRTQVSLIAGRCFTV